MGRDITLYTKQSTKKELHNFLIDSGYKKIRELSDRENNGIFYFWFEQEDYKSITGVEATIYPPRNDSSEWSLHLRNTYSASYYDVEKMISTMKIARKKFGGTIHGDYGTNRYPELWDDKSTPISRGLSFVYRNCSSHIGSVKATVPDPYLKINNPDDESLAEYIEFLQTTDPIRVLYSSLIPFAISAFEFFFSQSFQILLKYDKQAQDKIKESNLKILMPDVLKLLSNEHTIEGEIASKYSFQNIDSINKAYKDWLNIDIRKELYKRKKVGNRIWLLEKRIKEIIEFRHKVIHHFLIDVTLEKDEVIEIFETVSTIIETISVFFEKKYKLEIERF